MVVKEGANFLEFPNFANTSIDIGILFLQTILSSPKSVIIKLDTVIFEKVLDWLLLPQILVALTDIFSFWYGAFAVTVTVIEFVFAPDVISHPAGKLHSNPEALGTTGTVKVNPVSGGQIF